MSQEREPLKSVGLVCAYCREFIVYGEGYVKDNGYRNDGFGFNYHHLCALISHEEQKCTTCGAIIPINTIYIKRVKGFLAGKVRCRDCEISMGDFGRKLVLYK